jgi:hypothetical protein
LPVLEISTEPGVSQDENIAKIRSWIDVLLAKADKA